MYQLLEERFTTNGFRYICSGIFLTKEDCFKEVGRKNIRSYKIIKLQEVR